MMNMDNLSRYVYFGIAVILSILGGMMYYVTTVCCEDLWYQSASVGVHGTWEYFISTLNNCIDHWNWDTGRLCNTVSAPFLALFPHCVYSCITAILIAVIFIIGVRIAGLKWLSVSSAAWVGIVSFVIPWHDFMFTVVYSINYVWGCAFGLSIFYLFLKDYSDKRVGIFTKCALFLFAYVVGWWHEGMSMPLLIGLIVYLMVERKKPSVCRILILIGLSAGLVTIVSMPAFWLMTDERQSNIIKSVLWETLVHLFAYNCLFYIYTLLVILRIIKSYRKDMVDIRAKAFHCCVFVFGLISCIIYLKYYNGPRTGMFSQVFCGLGILNINKNREVRNQILLSYISMTLIFLLASASLVKSIIIQVKLSKEIDEVKELAYISEISTGKKIVFYDPTPISFGIDMLKPSYQILNTKYGLQGIELFPSCLKNFSLANKNLKRCTDARLIIFNNIIVYAESVPEERIDISLSGDNGEKVVSRTRFREFVTCDGDTVSYIIPHVQAMGSKMVITDAVLMDTNN